MNESENLGLSLGALLERHENAIAQLKQANYELAEVNLALGTFSEINGNHAEASTLYFDAGTYYREAAAPEETIGVADAGYRRCRDVHSSLRSGITCGPNRFRMR